MREIKFRAWATTYEKRKNPKTEMKYFNLYELYPPRDCPIMQYTGLKDKNGREIYEGDIFSPELIEENGFVEWDNKDSYFKLVFSDFSEPLYCYYMDELEVIGNIYENPELLEK